MNDRFVSFKIGTRHLAALDAVNGNLTAAINTLTAAWIMADMSALPADDVKRAGRGGGGRLLSRNMRLSDAVRHTLRIAGDGNLSAGVRRLALWSTQMMEAQL